MAILAFHNGLSYFACRQKTLAEHVKKLDIRVAKSRSAFHRNYQLHDLAQMIGERWLKRWGFTVQQFGEDVRHVKVWAAGEDKPDVLVLHRKVPVALVDWKAKSSRRWWLNKRAYDAYRRWETEQQVPAFIAFALFERGKQKLLKFKFVQLSRTRVTIRQHKAWDRNAVVEFPEDTLLPFRRDHFTRAVLKP